MVFRRARYPPPAPVYDLTAAAGFWGPESVPEEIGWTEVPGVSLKPGMFVARVTGTSMEPLIPDGSWCLFRPCPAGSRDGRIVLVQLGTAGAGENGGRFTVKKYHSELSTDLAVTAEGWRHQRVESGDSYGIDPNQAHCLLNDESDDLVFLNISPAAHMTTDYVVLADVDLNSLRDM